MLGDVPAGYRSGALQRMDQSACAKGRRQADAHEGDSEFRVGYVIRNQLERPLKLALHYIFPMEIERLTPDISVDISAKGEIQGAFIFKNKSGLAGSDYLTFLVAEMIDGNERKFIWSPARFKIEKNMPSKISVPAVRAFIKSWQWNVTKEGLFVFAWGLLSLLAFVWVYFHWERPREK